MAVRNKPRSGPLRFALYTRCSTDEQAQGEYTTLDAQAAQTQRHVLSLGGVIVKTYSDAGKTGKTVKRKEFQAMLADAEAGLFDAVCVTYFNRLGRGDACTVAEYLLKEAGVTVIAVHEQFSGDMAGFVTKGAKKFADGMYVESVRESTTSTMREMFDNGFVCGHVPFGYAKENADGMQATRGRDGKMKDPPQRAVPHDGHAETVRQAFALYLSTGTAAKVRDFLRTCTGRHWTTTQTTALLADERYTGVALFGQWRKEDAHAAIVDRETWQAARLLLTRHTTLYPAQNDTFTYYLRGRVHCPHCELPYTYAGATTRSGKMHYYVCQSVNRAGRDAPCPVRRVNADRLHLSVLHHLHYVTTHKTVLHKMIAQSGGWGSADDSLKTMRGQLGKQRQLWEMKRKNYTDAIGEGRALSTLLPALEKAEAELASITVQIAEADAQITATTVYRPTAERLAEGWGRLFEVWKVLTEDERAEAMGAIVARVDVGDKDNADVELVPGWGSGFTSALSTFQVGEPSGSGGWT